VSAISLAAALHGSGAHALVVRPGFVTGRVTQGMTPAPLASTPAQVANRTAWAIRHRRRTVWVPRALGPAALMMREPTGRRTNLAARRLKPAVSTSTNTK